MVYNIEFIRRIDGQAEALALGVVGEGIDAVIMRAEELYSKFDTVPRPDGFLIRESGVVVHEFHETQNA